LVCWNWLLGPSYCCAGPFWAACPWLNQALLAWLGGGLTQQLALLTSFALISGLLDLPVTLYQTFVIEERFGFNKMTMEVVAGRFGQVQPRWRAHWFAAGRTHSVADGCDGFMDGGYGPGVSGQVSICFLLLIYPTFIAPLFNSFKPLEDENLKTRVTALMQRCGFAAKGFFVMDGSKRSGHGNAYFTGFGASRRVVFFDTLLAKLSPS
jgi:STE24 endopeptidase